MSRVRNVSGGALDVPLLDRQVEAEEVVDVPDFQPAHNPVYVYVDADGAQQQRPSEPGDPEYLAVIWPPDKWEPVAEAKAPKSKAAV